MKKSKTLNNIKRNSSLEILRILSMIMIVAGHYANHGFENIEYCSNKYVIDMIGAWSKVGVNCFVLITGYFMVNINFSLKKLLKIWGQVLFYSILFYLLFKVVLIPYQNIGLKETLYSLFPITFECYWFATTYIMLLIIAPYCNIVNQKY